MDLEFGLIVIGWALESNNPRDAQRVNSKQPVKTATVG